MNEYPAGTAGHSRSRVSKVEEISHYVVSSFFATPLEGQNGDVKGTRMPLMGFEP